ncbi:MAG: hypothetical protein LBT86_05610 [Deltaproteobacteria bacterium]|jgi:hypothetical protein|nr:hypothetical protein [Deltaproteobacteria bacterium]
MAKKNRKGRFQTNLPLKDRLAKHWRNQDWLAFVELYYRDRSISDQSPWAERLEDGLYNALTWTIVDRPERTVITSLAQKLIIEAKGPDADILKKCAKIAWTLTGGSTPENFPSLKEITRLPEPYKTLGKKQNPAKPAAKRPVKITTPLGLTLQKLKKQFKNLPLAKTIIPFRTFLKTAQELRELLVNQPNEPIAQAIIHIATLLRDLKKITTRASDLSQLGLVYRHPSFQALLHPFPPHPFILSLWNLFCELGQEKHGPAWANGARLLALSFLPGLNRPLAGSFQQLMDFDDDDEDDVDFERFFASMFGGHLEDQDDLIHGPEHKLELLEFFNKSDSLLEQEEYIFNCLSLIYQEAINASDLAESDQKDLLFKFSRLTILGAKWRHGFAIWPPDVMEAFEYFFKETFTDKNLEKLTKIDLPWSQFSAPLRLAIIFFCDALDKNDIANLLEAIPENQLTDQQIAQTLEFLSARPCFGQGWTRLANNLPPRIIADLFDGWLASLVKNTSDNLVELGKFNIIFTGKARQFFTVPEKLRKNFWKSFTDDLLDFGHAYGSQQGLMKSFLDILVPGSPDKNPQKITTDLKKLFSFFKELELDKTFFVTNLLILTFQWPELEPSISISLIDASLQSLAKEDDFTRLLFGLAALDSKSLIKSLGSLIVERLNKFSIFKTTKNLRQASKLFSDLANNRIQLLAKELDLPASPGIPDFSGFPF